MRIAIVAFLLQLFAGSASGLDAVDRFTLPNGLTVLVGVERRLPLVNVTCLYRVGSANERPGITGLAHYVEHMAFRATENVSHADVTGTIERIGGRWNGYTWIDQTLYAATVPSWALESILRIEAERMSRVLFDPDAFERERTSVVAELQGYENDPASLLRDLAVATSFEIHPYRYNVIGWLEDVLSVEREEALAFYRDYYGPNHAYLSIVGDVDPPAVRELVERHFGSLPPSRKSAAVRVIEPRQRGKKVVELRRPGSLAHLLYVHRAPAAFDADFPAFLLLDALLAGGRGLLFGEREAAEGTPLAEAVSQAGGLGASTSMTASRAPFVHEIAARVRAPEDLDRVAESIDGLLDRLAREGPAERDLVRARRQLRAEAAFGDATLARIGHRLSYFEALGSWRRADEIPDALDEIGPSELRDVVRRYLAPERRTMGRHIPAESEAGAATTIAKVAPPPETSASGALPVPPEALEPIDLPPIARSRRALPNGAAVATARREGPGALRIRLALGGALDPPGKQGLALLAARWITSDPALLETLGAEGASWESSAVDSPTRFANRESFDIEIEHLPESRDAILDALGKAVARSGPTDEEVERLRSALLDEIAALADDPEWIAEREAIERADPDWRPPIGTAESVARIGGPDVRDFLSRNRVGAAFIAGLVGPEAPEDSLDALGRAFSALPSGEPAAPRSPSSGPARPETMRIPIAGKTQAEIVAALPGIPRDHPDALPLRLLSYVIGETGYAGRLGDLLVDSGLTYSVYALPEQGRIAGPLLIRTGAAPANVDTVLETIRSVLAELSAEGITEAEWNECRAFRVGRLVLDLDAPSGLAAALVDSEYFGEDRLDLAARSAEILAVSRERLNEAARRHLRPGDLSIAVAGAVSR